MAARITPEKIEMINELYAQCGVKKRVAEALGISPSTVSKYIIAGYIPKDKREIITFDKQPLGCEKFAKYIKESGLSPAKAFAEGCVLTLEEKEELKILQKEIMI